ncbi:MAG: carbon-nitrogen hydrolase family protein [Pseudomonadota bacterium]
MAAPKVKRVSVINRVVIYALTLVLLSASAHSLTDQTDEAAPPSSANLKIALLHLELKYADLESNTSLMERGIALAARHGADWVLTPELALTGYRFDLELGTEWIPFGPDQYVERIQEVAKSNDVVVFLGHLEKVESTITPDAGDSLFNTVFVINNDGDIVGRHQKLNVIPIAEDWSTPGTEASVLNIDGHKVGLLTCADAWPAKHAEALKVKGAEIILSNASWAPGEYGPSDSWENRSKETGLPLFVNNRTGIERGFDLTAAQSALSYQGERLFSHSSPNSKVLLIDWNHAEKEVVSTQQLELR